MWKKSFQLHVQYVYLNLVIEFLHTGHTVKLYKQISPIANDITCVCSGLRPHVNFKITHFCFELETIFCLFRF